MSFKPLVSVLMSVYNGELFLADAVKSILAQSYSDFELIVIDDGSSDKTPEILYQFVQMDQRIKVFKHGSNLGLTKSLNLGLAKCKGEFIVRHDADDLSEPERFACQVEFLRNYHDYGLVGTAVSRIDSQGNEIDQAVAIRGDKKIRGFMKGGNVFVHGSVMMRKSVIDAVGCYRTGFRYAQDYDLWLRISEISKIENLPDRLYRWRLHSAAISDEKFYDQTLYAALACHFAKERKEKVNDSYVKLSELAGDIDTLLNKNNLKNEIAPLIGRIFFRMGKREMAYKFLSDSRKLSDIIYYNLCRSDILFRLAHHVARLIIASRK
ncbi:MAG: glycosyltransferase family 2 protein [Candidatus Scalindua sp.]